MANPNLDDGKNTKKSTLENIDNTYENTLMSIYNIEEEEINLRDDPFFAAMKIPGVDYIPGETTDSEPTTEELEIDIDQQ